MSNEKHWQLALTEKQVQIVHDALRTYLDNYNEAPLDEIVELSLKLEAFGARDPWGVDWATRHVSTR
jgi:hypothetical protein